MFMRKTRTDSASAMDDDDALDFFPLERGNERRAAGDKSDFVDVSYQDNDTFDESLLYAKSGDAMRRLAFREWRRRVLKICFTVLLLAAGFVAFVVVQRAPIS